MARDRNHIPSDEELQTAIIVLNAHTGRQALDRVVLMLESELEQRERVKLLWAKMVELGEHCTIGQAREALRKEGHDV